uniref:VWFA domain-containing protein n=1 Tax=Alexandrium andersonii TaxID=327968 RepID=A0A7S2DSM9_9DINO
MARSELTLGRADAQKVVLVMTDGIPLSSRSTWIAATRLKRQARLMFGAVKLNSRGLRYMQAWGSSPARENVLRINSFRDLESLNTIDSLISDMCKNVAVPRAASSGR